MSQSVNVNFKLDADVKKSMEQVCSELGLSHRFCKKSRQRKAYSF